MEKLTVKQKNILEFISGFVSESGAPPTIREIASAFKITISPVQKYIKILIKKGYLKQTPLISRGLTLTSHKPLVPVPLVGRVRAGNISEAIENIEGYLHIDQNIVRHGEYFALTVKGDSMSGSGINEGDTVIIRKQVTANHNEIVVAMIGGDAAVKKLYRTNKDVYLISTNPKYAPIKSSEIQIAGKVVYLTRSYK
ncbi:MAG: transcriptional repressor LexA [Elusimicrobia bacterium]|nr:transcriptional repressor LexA [Elusimicrobiota bacterium]